MTENLVDLHLLLFKEDVQSDLQRTECREQMHTHEVRKCEAAFGCTDEQWTSLFKVRDVLARKIIVGQQPAAIRIAREGLFVQHFKQPGLTDLHTKRIGEFLEQTRPMH